MNDEQTLKMTELDYLTAAPHLQMIKAALPYVNASEQRFVSLFIKINELQRTMQLFDGREDGTVGICSLEEDAPSSPLDMLNAMKPYGTEPEQEFIDLIINFLQSSRIYQSYQEANEMPEEINYIKKQHSDDMVNSQSGNRQQQNNRQPRQEDTRFRNEPRRFPLEQLKNILPPEQQSRLETAQLLMQTFQQFS